MESLYPFQDGILKIVRELNLPFYLTGGTALSRHYFNHRYSDDIDLFVNDDPGFEKYIDVLYAGLEKHASDGVLIIDRKSTIRGRMYARFILGKPGERDVKLKIDCANDIAAHFGDFEYDEILGKIDGIRNMLSNKISAVFRYEPKDFADIWTMSKKVKFHWDVIIEEAKSKEAGTDPSVLNDIMKSFPPDAVMSVKWILSVDQKEFLRDLHVIADDIFYGRENSLCK